MAVVKANGYGHGLLHAAEGLQGADGFAVLGINEGLVLREAGYSQSILLLEGLFTPDELAVAAQHKISCVVHSEPQLHMLEAARDSAAVEVFLKVNTGMHRLGVPVGRFWSFYDRLRVCRSVKQVTLMTHFATADSAAGVTDQFERFDALTSEISRPRSMANSAALLRYPETQGDWVRPGIMLYGASPFDDTSAAALGLQPVMTLSSEIIAVQSLAAGEGLGYGFRFVADQSMRIGVVACGYADGYPRHAPTGTPIAVNGKMTRTLGCVSMDMMFVDLTDIPEADIGNPVELWGALVPVDDVAKAAGTISYELLCALAPRVQVVMHG
jgi:alanine racemase